MSIADIRQPQTEESVRPVRAEINSAFIQAYRKQVKESQKTFWARFGVTQSRGSRFELGANIPKPVMILLRLYFEARISDEDISSVSQKRMPALRPARVNPDQSTPFGSP
ncbi:XRE family transcriptional regulator [Trinickia dinghuensis]|uniref:XRE family transcriptional regulator n=1 Tax=Trinickia dinghuensis TaxID=2291023 RepID=A0A3D8JT81_9BURK|nr:XRE family transcriptional regulator [Trinickia dinghuensis]RDU96339.1 XRE family transcriptional regulator [Trinickia dinghuensis]